MFYSAVNMKNKKRKVEEDESTQSRLTSKQVCSLWCWFWKWSSKEETCICFESFIWISDSLSFFRDEQWNEPRRWRKWVCATMKATTSRTRTEKFQFQPPRVRGQKDPSSKIKKVIDQKICNKSLFKLAFYQNKTIEQKLWFICFHPHENNSIICEVKFIIPRFIS